MRLVLLFFTALIITAVLSTACLAQTEPPQSVQDNLSEIFGLWRDYLWEENDHFWHRGEYARCIQIMRLITQVDPHDFDAWEGGAWLLESELRDDEAEAFLLQGLAKNPDTYHLYFSLGRFYYYHTRYPEAIRYLQTAVVLDASQLAWRQLAHAYEMAGLVDDAFATWSIISSGNPNDPVPQLQMDRIMRGEPHHDTPGYISRAREERKAEEENKER